MDLHRVTVVRLEASQRIMGVGRGRRQRKSGCNLLTRLDLLLQGRGLRGSAGKRTV